MTRRIAAGLAILTALVHTGLGAFDTLYPTLAAAPSLGLARSGTIEAAWYILGLFLAWSARPFWRGGARAGSLGFVWILSGAVVLAVAFLRGGPPAALAMPQWILLIPTGAIAIAGSGR
ncbi:MAG: hypothetical protein ACFB00_01525 [Parvularculaceae bacterium]